VFSVVVAGEVGSGKKSDADDFEPLATFDGAGVEIEVVCPGNDVVALLPHKSDSTFFFAGSV